MVFIERHTRAVGQRRIWPKTYIVKNYKGDPSSRFIHPDYVLRVGNRGSWKMRLNPKSIPFLLDPE